MKTPEEIDEGAGPDLTQLELCDTSRLRIKGHGRTKPITVLTINEVLDLVRHYSRLIAYYPETSRYHLLCFSPVDDSLYVAIIGVRATPTIITLQRFGQYVRTPDRAYITRAAIKYVERVGHTWLRKRYKRPTKRRADRKKWYLLVIYYDSKRTRWEPKHVWVPMEVPLDSEGEGYDTTCLTPELAAKSVDFNRVYIHTLFDKDVRLLHVLARFAVRDGKSQTFTFDKNAYIPREELDGIVKERSGRNG